MMYRNPIVKRNAGLPVRRESTLVTPGADFKGSIENAVAEVEATVATLLAVAPDSEPSDDAACDVAQVCESIAGRCRGEFTLRLSPYGLRQARRSAGAGKVAMQIEETGGASAATLLSKVPEVTFYFWIIKVMATTVGETAADFLSTNLHLGLTTTTVVISALLAVGLVFQFRAMRYVGTSCRSRPSTAGWRWERSGRALCS